VIGYREAGDRLVDSLTGAPWEDSLIYPILYLYRHHLELELKPLVAYALRNFPGLEVDALERKLADLKKNHDLGSLWNQLEYFYPRCNKGSSLEAQQSFRSLLKELTDQDPTGEAGRYETDVCGNQTLSRLTVVDAATFKAGIHKMSNYLRQIGVGIDLEIEGRREMENEC
jgi:hypothetical protein